MNNLGGIFHSLAKAICHSILSCAAWVICKEYQHEFLETTIAEVDEVILGQKYFVAIYVSLTVLLNIRSIDREYTQIASIVRSTNGVTSEVDWSEDNNKVSLLKVLLLLTSFSLVVLGLLSILFPSDNVPVELIHNNSVFKSYNIGISIPKIPVGSEIALKISSEKDMYVYLFNLGSNKVFSQLNDSKNNLIQMNSTNVFPSAGYQYRVMGPVGLESVVVVASKVPLSLMRLQEILVQERKSDENFRHLMQMPSLQRNLAILEQKIRALMRYRSQGDEVVKRVFFEVVDDAEANVVDVQPKFRNQSYMPNFSQRGYNPISSYAVTTCAFADLHIALPNQNAIFRCVRRTLDANFESAQDFSKTMQHFAKELEREGFKAQKLLEVGLDKFQAVFVKQGKLYRVQIIQQGEYHRFELIELGY